MLARLLLPAALAAAIVAVGASALAGGRGAPRATVAAFYPLAYAAEAVGAPAVEDLTPPGTEPHDVELSPRTVARIARARTVLYLGRGFQPAVERAARETRGAAVDLLAGLPVRAAAGGPDPHVWLDPLLFARIATRVGAALDRPRAGARLAARARALDAAFRRGLARCERRELVTLHAAFGYLAARYGLRQVPIEGLAPEAEPAPRDLERIARTVRATGATTVFAEPLVARQVARTVAREAGARVATLDPLESLTAAQLARGETYFGVMRANLRTLREALGCR